MRKSVLLQLVLLFILSAAACESDSASDTGELVEKLKKSDSSKEITALSFRGFSSTVYFAQDSDAIRVLINTTDELLTQQVALFTYTGFAIKKDGVIQENGITSNNFSANSQTPAVYTVVAEDGSERNYDVYVSATGYEKRGPVTDLVITEWGDAGSNIDYIELKNFGEGAVYLPADLTIHFGRTSDGKSPNSSVTLAEYSTDSSTWITVVDGEIRIGPGEYILVGDSDLNEGLNLDDFRYGFGESVGAPFKIFRADSESTLVGTRDRLSEGPAWLSSGGTTWSRTPQAELDSDGDPVTTAGYFGGEVGTSTYSCLNESVYQHGTSSTEDCAVWSNGSSSTHSTPGAGFSE